ncbi:MAG: molybdopterin molybdotransferase MoeA [Desulfobacterales bacterium]|nr:molybdopterin molybdotransferase MoeA [Desulfobacterales bacterium]
MTKEFFTATPVNQVFDHISEFARVGDEKLPTAEACGRILARDVFAQTSLPGFARATMDGYAVRAAATFGASESSPAYLEIIGTVQMGMAAQTPVGHGQAAAIATGGMLPEGADAVVMIEHAARLDETALEVYKSVAPGANVVAADEDVAAGRKVLDAGSRIRPQEMGLMAALGMETIRVFKKPVIGIISTGDELVEIGQNPAPGQIRDVNTYSLAGCVTQGGGIARTYGIVADRLDALRHTCTRALSETDMVLISGGSSVGTRDLTLEVIESLPDSQILCHGIPIRPGKPTILAKTGQKAFWGLPGQIASAMVVFDRIVAAFVGHISGNALSYRQYDRIPAVLTRNLASVQGRTDYVRARILEHQGRFYAEPILGPSGLIRTLVAADGLIEIDMNTEGLEKGETVFVTLLR